MRNCSCARAPARCSTRAPARRAPAKATGRGALRPWGVSESGYHAFDMHLNYQYRAFGLREVALGGGTRQSVVAPYASLLALCICPGKVADNVLAMREAGWAGGIRLFRGRRLHRRAPGRRTEAGQKLYGPTIRAWRWRLWPNALAGDAISRCFESIPEARALSLLLEEKALRPRETASQARGARARKRAPRRGPRAARGALRKPPRGRASALRRGTTALFTARGCALYAREGVLASRCFGDLLDPRGDIRLTVRTERGEEAGLSQGSARFEAGGAQYENTLDGVDISINACLSPEDGTLFHAVRLRNGASAARETEMTLSFPVALCHRATTAGRTPPFRAFSSPPRARKGARSSSRAVRALRAAAPGRSRRWPRAGK